jgi:transcription elongation GreA/GreB family factor
MTEISYFTQEGFDKLKEELRQLKTKGRADIARQIQEAREKVTSLKTLNMMQPKMPRGYWKQK